MGVTEQGWWHGFSGSWFWDHFCNHVITSETGKGSGKWRRAVGQWVYPLLSPTEQLCLYLIVQLCHMAPFWLQERPGNGFPFPFCHSYQNWLFVHEEERESRRRSVYHKHLLCTSTVQSILHVVIHWDLITALPYGYSLFCSRKWRPE